MKVTCPHCNNSFPLESLTEDDSARQLFGLLGKNNPIVAAHVIPYLGLFKPRNQALRWSRALKLTQEILEMCQSINPHTAANALVKSVEGLREKRQQPNWKPLRNHNYLKVILESEPLVNQQVSQQTNPIEHNAQGPQSATGKALLELEKMKSK